MSNVATRIYNNNLGSARTVSTGSMRVFLITITNTTNAVVDYEITDAAGNGVFNITVPADNTHTIEISNGFIVQGMIVAAEAATSYVTVLYSADA